MKKIILISGLAILGLAALGYLRATPAAETGSTSGPRIEISPANFNFGDIEYGQVMEYDFTVRNSGNEILEIKRVATSCSCTSAKISREKINPGETALLHVRYDSGAMGSAHGRGRQERIIYLRSNDAQTAQIETMIYANVK